MCYFPSRRDSTFIALLNSKCIRTLNAYGGVRCKSKDAQEMFFSIVARPEKSHQMESME